LSLNFSFRTPVKGNAMGENVNKGWAEVISDDILFE
jgi:hypothetical protein